MAYSNMTGPKTKNQQVLRLRRRQTQCIDTSLSIVTRVSPLHSSTEPAKSCRSVRSDGGNVVKKLISILEIHLLSSKRCNKPSVTVMH